MTPKATDLRDRLLTARLPAMPQILTRLLWLCSDESTSLADLAALVSHDAAVTARLLGVANSAAHHPGGRRLGIDQAIGLLGMNQFKSVVIAHSIMQVFQQFSGTAAVDLRAFWHHTLRTAVLARDLAAAGGYTRPDEAYLAGLLHDVGRLAMLATAPNEYASIFETVDDDAVLQREKAALGLDHAEAGAWLAGRWQLDGLLADSILYHHEPASRLAGTHPLLVLAALAHRLADHPQGDAVAVEALREAAGIGVDAVAGVLASADVQTRRVAEALGIELPPAPRPPAPAERSVAAVELAAAVRDVVLAQNTGTMLAAQEDEVAVVDGLLRAMSLLFAFDDALCLRLDRTSRVLQGLPVGRHAAAAAALRIALDGARLIAEAVEHGHAVCRPLAAKTKPDIGEAQLGRILGQPVLCAVPLTADGRCEDVLVVGGLDGERLESLSREPLLRLFAAQGGRALAECRGRRLRLESLQGRLGEQYRLAARKIAHEVNNPLAIIRNYLFLLKGKRASGEGGDEEIRIIGEEIERVGRLVAGMTDTAAKLSGPLVAELAEVVGSSVEIFRSSGFLPPAISLRSELPDGLPGVAGDPDVLRQVVDNLVKNAIEAMPDGGEIVIAASGVVHRGGRAFVELVVRDSGPGLPPERLASLFAPGASTKGAGRGLGLSIVRDLVVRLGGEIQCRSASAGTAFEIQLPIAGGAEAT